MALLAQAASNIWGSLITRTKSWWQGLDARDKIIYVLTAVAIGVIGYQHFALSHARQDIDSLNVQIKNMVTQQQIDALNQSIGDVQVQLSETQKTTEAARADAKTALQKVSQPFKPSGMKSNEIVQEFQSLSGNGSH